MVLQPVPSYNNQALSSSSESDDGEPEISGKPKTAKPLKGILKKPKMIENVPEKKCNESVMPGLNENVKPSDNMLEDAVFTPVSDSQTGSQDFTESGAQSESRSSLEKSLISDDANEKKVFDAGVKPKRGILKRKGKFSSGDSGCDLNDTSRKESVGLSVRAMDLSEADSALDSPSQVSADIATKSCDIQQNGAFSFNNCSIQTANTSIPSYSENVPNISVVPRRRGILKNANRDPDKRLSACSTGSNSSADILDLSYDSFDNFLTSRFCNDTGSEISGSFGEEFRDVRLQGQEALRDDLFSYQEAKTVLQNALDICKDC
jgi:hypothetical protein